MSEAAITSYEAEESVEEVVTEEPEEVTSEAPETEEAPEVEEAPKEEPISFTPEQQAYIENQILQKHIARKGVAEEKAREYANQVEQLQAKLSQFEQQSQVAEDGGPVVPEVPEMWDENYQQKMQQREEAIVARARWEDQQSMQQAELQRKQQEEFDKQQEWIKTKREQTMAKAKKLGLSSSEVQMAADVVANAMSREDHLPLIMEIADHELGPKISHYLSQRAQELNAVAEMPPIRAWSHIEKNVIPNIKRQMTRETKAPPPAEQVEGNAGAKPSNLPKGVKIKAY